MTEYVLVAAALAVTVAVVVSLAVISVMIHREDTCYTVTEPTSDRLARYVRLVTGVGVRNLGGASRMPPELVPMAGRDVIPP
jgi:hypothetical protein